MNKLINDYFSMRLGFEPTEEQIKIVTATANYLKDNGKTNQEIFKILMSSNKSIVTGDDLPESLWKDSLLEKGVFYYNNRLHMTSKPPTWNPKTFKEECEPFYMEMIINFTMEDLLSMYYTECRVPVGLRNKTRDEGAMSHLINKYNNLKAPGLDYVMLMIDLANKDVDLDFLSNPFKLEDYSKEAFIILEDIASEAMLTKGNIIKWRE